MDLRRFHYTDTSAGEARQAFPGFAPPTNLYVDNQGEVAHRLRPRFNSEYVWNQDGLAAIQPVSGLEPHYHTVELWITQP